MVHARRGSRVSGEGFEKITMTLPSRLLQAARTEAAQAHARSLSAYIAQALEDKLAKDDFQEVLDEIFAEQPMTDEERARADQYLLDQ